MKQLICSVCTILLMISTHAQTTQVQKRETVVQKSIRIDTTSFEQATLSLKSTSMFYIQNVEIVGPKDLLIYIQNAKPRDLAVEFLQAETKHVVIQKIWYKNRLVYQKPSNDY